MNYLIVYLILGAVVAGMARWQRKRFEREAARHAQQQARRDWDRIDALIIATREKPHESYAFGPDADQPVPYLPVEVGDFAEWESEWQKYRLEQESSER